MKEIISTMRYPGRFIAIGMDGEDSVVIYGATGRSPSSLARRFVELEDGVYMTAHDATVAIHGNPDLLEYPAIRYFENGVAVANGQHIERIQTLEARDARQQLSYALSEEAYEPDEHRTPRITGIVVEGARETEAALHIIRSVSDGIDRASWNVTLQGGSGKFIATYTGEDVKPTPSFSGAPRDVTFNFGRPESAARFVYDALKPATGAIDYRVGVIAVYKHRGEESRASIINRIAG